MSRESNVLFVCLHGAAKSVIAAQHFRRLAAERRLDLVADAAGMEPDAEIPPHVIAGLAGDGIDVVGNRPQAMTPERARGALRIVSFGCDLSQVAADGVEVESWTDVPAVSDGYAEARRVIVKRVEDLVDRLTSDTPG
jgi:protein-tyrosine-phosphatase